MARAVPGGDGGGGEGGGGDGGGEGGGVEGGGGEGGGSEEGGEGDGGEGGGEGVGYRAVVARAALARAAVARAAVVVAALARTARVTVMAARGNVWRGPDAMAQPVINEGEVGRGRRRVLGWAQGGCGAGHTIGGSTFRRAGSQGGRGELPGKEGFARKSAGVRSRSYLGELSQQQLEQSLHATNRHR